MVMTHLLAHAGGHGQALYAQASFLASTITTCCSDLRDQGYPTYSVSTSLIRQSLFWQPHVACVTIWLGSCWRRAGPCLSQIFSFPRGVCRLWPSTDFAPDFRGAQICGWDMASRACFCLLFHYMVTRVDFTCSIEGSGWRITASSENASTSHDFQSPTASRASQTSSMLSAQPISIPAMIHPSLSAESTIFSCFPFAPVECGRFSLFRDATLRHGRIPFPSFEFVVLQTGYRYCLVTPESMLILIRQLHSFRYLYLCVAREFAWLPDS